MDDRDTTKNYPGCPPGSPGRKCETRVPCPNGVDNQGCSTQDCWPKELNDNNSQEPGVCLICKAGSAVNANDIPIWNYKTEQWGCGPPESKFTPTAPSAKAGGSYEFRFARRQNQGDTEVVTCKLEYNPTRLKEMVGYDLVLQVQEYNEMGQFW